MATPYCTQSDLEKRIRASELVQLANDDGGSTVDSDILDAAINDASVIIDAHAGDHYSVPFAPVPDLIVKLACDQTIVCLCDRRGASPKWLEAKEARTKGMLKALAAGTLTLGQQPSPDRNPERLPVRVGDPPVFTADSLKGF